jgi:hypothetical protein
MAIKECITIGISHSKLHNMLLAGKEELETLLEV